MNKKGISVFKLISISAFLILGVFTANFSASPLRPDVCVSQSSVLNGYHEFFVKDSRDLTLCANSASEGDRIILLDNIYLDSKICLKSSCCLDLNGHTIFVGSDNEAVVIGQKEFSHKESYVVRHPGYYTWEDKIKIVEHPGKFIRDGLGRLVFVHVPPTQEITKIKVWHPETFETRYKDIYKYKDDIDIIIQNGKIKKLRGCNGKDGLKDSWQAFNGESGATPLAPIQVISGTVRFYNARIKGGNGGNGGNGGYQSLIHLPLGGGDAGSGGNGGNAGCAIHLERKDCRIIQNITSHLSSGKPGKGGKAGQPNPNHWIYSGWSGKDGENGKNVNPMVIG